MSTDNMEKTEQRYDRVIRRIAPVWPLDSFVAVNPYWGFADQPVADAAAYLQETVGERVIMDQRWYADLLQKGKLNMADILQASVDLGVDMDEFQWRRYLRGPAELPPPGGRRRRASPCSPCIS